MDAAKKVAGAAAAAVAAKSLWTRWADDVTAKHSGAFDLHELIALAPQTGLRVAVVGLGISGVQAMKACLADGIELARIIPHW